MEVLEFNPNPSPCVAEIQSREETVAEMKAGRPIHVSLLALAGIRWERQDHSVYGLRVQPLIAIGMDVRITESGFERLRQRDSDIRAGIPALPLGRGRGRGEQQNDDPWKDEAESYVSHVILLS